MNHNKRVKCEKEEVIFEDKRQIKCENIVESTTRTKLLKPKAESLPILSQRLPGIEKIPLALLAMGIKE